MFTGADEVGLTLAPGVRLQVAFVMLVLHETVTLWLNDPAAVTSKLTGDDFVPSPTVTLAGDGVVSPKFTK
jgi:hypothetical protein